MHKGQPVQCNRSVHTRGKVRSTPRTEPSSLAVRCGEVIECTEVTTGSSSVRRGYRARRAIEDTILSRLLRFDKANSATQTRTPPGADTRLASSHNRKACTPRVSRGGFTSVTLVFFTHHTCVFTRISRVRYFTHAHSPRVRTFHACAIFSRFTHAQRAFCSFRFVRPCSQQKQRSCVKCRQRLKHVRQNTHSGHVHTGYVARHVASLTHVASRSRKWGDFSTPEVNRHFTQFNGCFAGTQNVQPTTSPDGVLAHAAQYTLTSCHVTCAATRRTAQPSVKLTSTYNTTRVRWSHMVTSCYYRPIGAAAVAVVSPEAA